MQRTINWSEVVKSDIMKDSSNYLSIFLSPPKMGINLLIARNYQDCGTFGPGKSKWNKKHFLNQSPFKKIISETTWFLHRKGMDISR